LVGTRAEYNDSYFKELSIQIVTKGIDSRRDLLLERIDEKRVDSKVRYSPARVIADAMDYHMSCSVVAALEEASDKIEEANNLTLENARKNIAEINKILEEARLGSLKQQIDGDGIL